jgi:hypothetical protein
MQFVVTSAQAICIGTNTKSFVWYSKMGEACKLQAGKKAAVVVVLVATEQYVLWCWWLLKSTFCGASGH